MSDIIKVKKYHAGRPGYYELENGIWIRDNRDGTGINEDDNSGWTEVQQPIGEDEYLSLGWKQN